MNSLNIDLRDGSLRIIATKDGSVKYSEFIKDFPITDEKSAKERLASEIKESGAKKGRTNIVLPSDIVRYKTFQIPAMDFEDAKKVIKREISREVKGQKFGFGIRRLLKDKRAKAGMQEILAEYVLTADIITYLSLLNSCGIKPDIMTSSLEGNVRLFNRFRSETDGNEAVLDIGTDLIEIAVFNNGRLLEYERLLIPQVHDERFETKNVPAEQTDKIKIYRIVDVLYNFIMASGKDSPEERLSALWICGPGSLSDGFTDSISDGLGVKSILINPFDTAIENGNAFNALAGLSTISRTEQFVNLIPEDILEKRTRLLRRTVLAASLSFYLILLTGGYAVLKQTEKDLKILLNDETKSVRITRSYIDETAGIYMLGKETFVKIVSDSPGLYPVFRDIANLIPSGVILDKVQIEKAQGITNLKIDATIQYNDENFKNALLSKFLTSLDRSSRLKRVSDPEITTSRSVDRQKEILIKAEYEVVE